jgi:eukaryotic-like serine/threonine-protein kinase
MLGPGTRVGPYEIVSWLGAGGMGEVYRARDTNLHREVALKTLPDELARQPERLARLKQEARILASLNHPGIATLHGLEESNNGLPVLVMELVEGETLADYLRRGPLPLREAIVVAKQIAQALEAAHERGVLHRDLKPANIRLGKDGRVKVLDFGLAKAIRKTTLDSQIPTQTSPSDPAAVVGTAPYMSPEQARGQEVDRRTDVWAFGCVLYEMLSGKRAFGGATSSDAVAAVLDREPDWQALPTDTSPAVLRLLRRCLEKDKGNRLRDIGDARLDLEEPEATSRPREEAPAITGLRRLGRLAVAAAVVALAAIVVFPLLSRARPHITSVTKLTDTSFRPSSAVTDGKNVYFVDIPKLGGSPVFFGNASDEARLMVIPIDGGEAREIQLPWHNRWLQITDIFSDGTALLVVRNDGQLWRVPVPAGTPTRLGDIAGASYATWARQGDRLAYETDAIYVANADGRNVRKLLDRATDGREFKLVGWTPDGRSIRCVRSDSLWLDSFWDVAISGNASPQYVFSSDFWAIPDVGLAKWTPDGRYFLFWDLYKGLLARREGAAMWTRTPEIVPLGSPPFLWSPSVTPDGRTLVVIHGQMIGQLQRYDAKTRGFLPHLGGMSALQLEYSPDGAWVAWVSFDSYAPMNRLWRARSDGTDKLQLSDLDLDNGNEVRWSPDGRRIAFSAWDRGGGRSRLRIYLAGVDGGAVEPLTSEDPTTQMTDNCWAPDGRSLVYASNADQIERRYLRRVDIDTRHVTPVPGSEGLVNAKCARDGRIFSATDLGPATPPRSNERWTYKVLDPERGTWKVYELPESIRYANWSRDGRYVYGMAETPHRIARLELATGRLETVAAIDTLRLADLWTGLTPDDSPMVLRDGSQWEIYRLDWDAP